MSTENATTWNRMTEVERARLLKRDPTLRDPAWRSMVSRVSATAYEGLTGLQQAMVDALMKKGR